MARIQVKRNTLANIPSLNEGEPFWATDTKAFYLGTGSANIPIGGSLYFIDANIYGSAYNSTTINAAITAIGTTNKVCLLLRPGAWVMNANITVPENITLKVVPGALITTTGYTLTINAPPEIGDYQVFSGAGTVTGLKKVNAYWFGATGDGVTDDSTNLQKAFTAAAGGADLYIPDATFLCNDITIPAGVKNVYGPGVLKGSGTHVTAVLLLAATLEDCQVQTNIDMSAGDGTAIELSAGASNNTIENCHLYGFTTVATHSRFGIIGRAGCNYNKIINNTIEMHESSSGTYTANAISFYGTTLDYGGYFTTPTDASVPCVGNVITGNQLFYGEVGIDLLGSDHTNIANNFFYKQQTRAIYLANSSHHNNIADNNFKGAASSAILIGYCSHDNVVSGNIIMDIAGYNSVGGEAAINLIVGVNGNIITANHIASYTNYGIYLGVNVSDNTISNNYIEQHYICAIALEGEWQDSPPALALYSRPNYAAPPSGTDWASANSTGNVIENNVIGSGFTDALAWVTSTSYAVSIVVLESATYYRCLVAHISGTFADDLAAGKWVSIGAAKTTGSIYVSQLQSASATDYYVRDNTVQGNVVTRYLANNWPYYWFEETSGYLTSNIFTGNHAKDVAMTRYYLSRAKDHFSDCYGNDALNDIATVIQPAPTAKTTAVTLTIAEILTGIITGTHTAGATQAYTLPTGTLADASKYFAINDGFDWILINLSTGANTITLTAGADHTIVGDPIVAITSSAAFRTRKTAENTFVTYRIN